jgi:DNA polymerase-3 subunit alpha
VFPAVYQAAMLVLALDRIVVVRARIKRGDEGLDLNAAEVTEAMAGNAQSTGPLAVTIPVARCTGEVIAAFKGTLSAHPGVTEVHLRLVGTEGVKVMRLDESFRVDPSSSLISELKELLGPQCIS